MRIIVGKVPMSEQSLFIGYELLGWSLCMNFLPPHDSFFTEER